MTHTPGPWNLCRHATPEHSPQFGVYAEGQQNDFAIVRYTDAEANARLIAAAPDLLEALERLLIEYRALKGLDDEYATNAATAALRKARGE